MAGKLKKGKGFGLLGNMVVGIVGGFVGGWLAGHFGIGGGGLIWQIAISTGGALFLLFVFSLIKK